jgi:hypothetical protein
MSGPGDGWCLEESDPSLDRVSFVTGEILHIDGAATPAHAATV